MITNSDRNNKTAARPIERIAVLGAGTMGHGIAQVAAAAGYEVVLRDIDEDAVTRGRQAIERNLAKGVQLGSNAAGGGDNVDAGQKSLVHAVDPLTIPPNCPCSLAWFSK